MKGVEELVPLVGMKAEEALLALFQLLLEGLNGSGQALVLCDQGGSVSMCVMVWLELSCNSPVLLGLQVVGHGCVSGVAAEQLKEPVRELPLFINSDALRGE